MTPEQHAEEAERLLAAVEEYNFTDSANQRPAELLLRRAQVHATLATRRPAGGSSPGGELRDALSALKATRHSGDDTARRGAYHAVIRLIADIDDEDEREKWIARVKAITLNHLPQIRRDIRQLR